MRYQLKFTKVDPTLSLKEYAEEKLVSVLEKHLGAGEDPWRFLIEVGRNTMHHRKGEIWFAEVTGSSPFGQIRVREEASEIHEAIDLAEAELKTKLTKSKEKITTRGIRAARRVKDMMRLSRLVRFFRRK
ncbi:MAG: HPF/RaiA family ribosome-associated protein [Candidatus Sungbacteria bacterium]|uniref:HPF/RaiA family ribosome-associated protein n=1 Tax=Candidatus Sungiibacteriota bacterium TaxID=2750080 RepID=A0A9D6QRQ3_9BACT|nr:HPF/RaiA family ribosome-associated protein [Candidatus Sungbacteria bacterium]